MTKTVIKEILKENRPKLADSSLVTYTSIIDNLFKRMRPNTEFSRALFDDTHAVLHELSTKPSNTRKTILSALVIFTLKDKVVSSAYRTVMMADGAKTSHADTEQKMTENQRANWVTQGEVHALFERLDKETKPLFSMYSTKNRPITNEHMGKMQDFITLALYTLIPVRRLMDYCEFKVRNVNTATDNFMQRGQFVFHKYKTAKVYGEQTVKLPIRLKNLVQKWMSMTTNDWLLFNPSTNEPLTNVQLNQRLHRIFGKNVSVNILRHSYLTHQYANIPALVEMEKRAHDMGQSVDQALRYIKQDAPGK